jgi:hypothetical protein
MTPVSEKHGLHWLAHLAIFSVGDVSPLARVWPPSPPRSATNKGWPPWPTFPAGGATRCKTSCYRNDSSFGETWTTLVGQLGRLQCRRCFSETRVLPPLLPRSATNKGWPPWPTFPQAAQRVARQSVIAMTSASGETRTTRGQLGSLGCLKRRPRRAASPHRLPCRTRHFNMPGGESIRGISTEFGKISKTVHRPSPLEQKLDQLRRPTANM